jgi:hypothetical protein
VFNLDETNLRPDMKPVKVLAPRSVAKLALHGRACVTYKNVTLSHRSHCPPCRGSGPAHTEASISREGMTVLMCISASGRFVSPAIVVKGGGQRVPRFWGPMMHKLKGTPLEHATCVSQVQNGCSAEC